MTRHTLHVPTIAAPVLPPPAGVDREIADQLRFLARPGATLTGAERVRVAAVARHARRTGTVSDDGPPLDRAAARIAAAAHTIDRDWVDALFRDGPTVHHYVEVLGIVARTTAIDTAVRGLGAPPVQLPDAVDGAPNGVVDDQAKQRSAFVPTIGAANPITVLNSIPAESAHQERLSDVLYLSYAEMADLDIHRDLHRTQMEVVAARTSSVNECVY